MIPENRAALLRAFRSAIEAEQDGIADMLEDIILGEMDGSHEVPIRIHGISDDTTIKPPWNVMLCDSPTKMATKTPTKVDE